MDINQFFRQLDGMFSRGELSLVEPYLLNGLQAAEQEQDAAAVISIANELGGFYRVQTRYAESTHIFEKALKNISAMGLADSQPHATTLLNYATMLTAAGDLVQAAAMFEKAADIFHRLGGAPYALAALHNNISSLYFQQQEYDRAMEQADAALQCVSRMPNNEDEVGVTQTKRAQIFNRQGRREEALATLELGQTAFEGAAERNQGHYAALLLTKGEVYGDLGRWAESELACQQALEMVTNATGNSLSRASVLRMLARAQRALGQEAEATASEQEAEAIRKQLSGGVV